MYQLCILYPWRLPQGWPKHVKVYRMYKANFIILVWICWYCYCSGYM